MEYISRPNEFTLAAAAVAVAAPRTGLFHGRNCACTDKTKVFIYSTHLFIIEAI